jgi:DHA1 family L-arabinose/isopropyl-beta-D-thiogalactopyranoside export protein-like MFS transporter
MMTGNFTMYSYIEPYLAQVAGMAEGTITLTLAAYGLVGLLASWLFSHFYDRAPFAFMRASVVGIAVTILLMGPASGSEPAIIALAVVWGLFVTFYGLVFQSSVITAAPTGTAVAMSVYSGIFNVGIGSGALVGGLVCTHLSIADIGYVGGGISAAAALFCLAFVVPVFKKLRDEQRRAKETPDD